MTDLGPSLADARLQAHADRLRALVPPAALSLAPQIARSIPWRALGDPASPGWSDRLLRAVTARIQASVPGIGSAGGRDVMAIAFLVLMQAAKSAQEDLKAIMDGVKAINRAKQELRALLQRLQERTDGTARTRVPWPPWPPR